MIPQAYRSRILIVLFIGALISSCSDPEQPAHRDVSPVTERASDTGTDQTDASISGDVPEQTINNQDSGVQPPLEPADKPALNLSIQDLADMETGGENGIEVGSDFTDGTEQQAQNLITHKKDDGMKLSGKLFTDQTMIDNKQYLDSVDGIQVNIEGNFR
jgi:hypothetical protein